MLHLPMWWPHDVLNLSKLVNMCITTSRIHSVLQDQYCVATLKYKKWMSYSNISVCKLLIVPLVTLHNLVALHNRMKNWKRRFFVLTEASLAYYKTFEVSWYTCWYHKGLSWACWSILLVLTKYNRFFYSQIMDALWCTSYSPFHSIFQFNG